MAKQTKKLNPFALQYWPLWITIGLFWLLCQLPYRWQLKLGAGIGKLMYRFSKKAKHVGEVNLKLCFPEKSATERETILQKSFESLGIGFFELGLACFASKERLLPLLHYHGQENIDAAIANGQGCIALGAHFTTLQIVGRMMAFHYDFAILYREHKKPFVNYLLERFAYRFYYNKIKREDTRAMLRTVKKQENLWFTPDVDVGGKSSIFVPFFGVPTATTVAPAIFAKLGPTIILPISFYRRDDGTGYDVYFDKPLENFPTDAGEKDMTRINAITEAAIRKKPEQYLWQYMRFKSRPEGEKRFY
jgi:Kdo2-lipid IVA lauroyltransferase/acyltransferase